MNKKRKGSQIKPPPERKSYLAPFRVYRLHILPLFIIPFRETENGGVISLQIKEKIRFLLKFTRDEARKSPHRARMLLT